MLQIDTKISVRVHLSNTIRTRKCLPHTVDFLCNVKPREALKNIHKHITRIGPRALAAAGTQMLHNLYRHMEENWLDAENGGKEMCTSRVDI